MSNWIVSVLNRENTKIVDPPYRVFVLQLLANKAFSSSAKRLCDFKVDVENNNSSTYNTIYQMFIHLLEEDINNLPIVNIKKRKEKEDPIHIDVFFEMLFEDDDNDENFAGCRFFAFISGKEGDLHSHFYKMLDFSRLRKLSRKRTDIPFNVQYQQITDFQVYVRIAGFYEGTVKEESYFNSKDVWGVPFGFDENPVSLHNIFSYKTAFLEHNEGNICKKQKNKDNYRSKNQNVSKIGANITNAMGYNYFFPISRRVYRIPLSQVSIENLIFKSFPGYHPILSHPLLLDRTYDNRIENHKNYFKDEIFGKQYLLEDDEIMTEDDNDIADILENTTVPGMDDEQKYKLYNDNISIEDSRFKLLKELLIDFKDDEYLKLRKESFPFIKAIKNLNCDLKTKEFYYGNHVNWVIKSYKLRCCNIDDDITKVGRTINTYSKKVQLRKMLPTLNPLTKIDHNLSIFANFIIKQMNRFDKIFLVLEKHHYLLICWLSSLSSYWFSYSLHPWIVIHGVFETGKSFLLQILSNYMLINNSTETIIRATRMSDTIEDHRYDTIFFYEEFMNSLLNTEDVELINIWKAKTTNPCVKTMIFDRDYTGRRISRMITSLQITTYICLTNQTKDKIDKNLASRMLQLYSAEVNVSKKRGSIPILKWKEMKKKIESHKEFDETEKEFKLLHDLYFHVEKLIMEGGLAAVSLDVAIISFVHVNKKMREEKFKLTYERSFEYYLIFCRSLTILNALVQNFFIRSGQHYQKEEIDVSMYKDINEDLYCTFEISIFVLGLLDFIYVDPAEKEIKKVLKNIYEDRTKVNINMCFEGSDATYFSPGQTIRELSSEIFNVFETEVEEYRFKYDKDKISTILFNWINRTLKSKEKTLEGGKPNDTGVIEKLRPIIEFKTVGEKIKHIRILTQWLENSKEGDYFKTAVESLFHKYTINQTYLFGRADNSDPHIFETIKTKKSNEIFKFINVLYKDEMTEIICNGYTQAQAEKICNTEDNMKNIELNYDFDTYGLLQHRKALFKSTDFSDKNLLDRH